MLVILACMFVVVYAGREPYLGEDIDILIEKSKRSGVTAISRESPITEEQKRDYERYNTKFTEIAKAYAEGYKAAIKAVQARAIIAQKRLQQMQVNNIRSSIPDVPDRGKTERSDTSLFNFPATNEVTENGIEKSEIPHPVNNDHRVFERSVQPKGKENNFGGEPIGDYQRDDIAHADDLSGPTVYFQHQKKKRSSDEPRKVITRHRRSRMPYLGQNLDALGIVRAKPNWEKPVKKSLPNAQSSASTADPLIPNPYFSQHFQPVYMQSPPSQQQFAPEPYQQQAAFFRAFAPSYPAQAQNQQMSGYFNTPQSVQMRSFINNAIYPPYSYQQNYGKVISNQPSSVETTQRNEEVVQKKRSASPEPSVEKLNYAARHRNVYLDNISGDPYSGGSAVLSRQNVIYKN